MSEKNNPPPPSEEAVRALSESILAQMMEIRAQAKNAADDAQAEDLPVDSDALEDGLSFEADSDEASFDTDDSEDDIELNEIFSDAAELERYRKTLETLLFDDVTGFVAHLDSEVYSGFMEMLKANYSEHSIVQDDPDLLEWWSIDVGLWSILAEQGEVTIEFQWSEEDAYYLWGRVNTGLPAEFEPALIKLWKTEQLEDDTHQSFVLWPIAELKQIYTTLQKNILNVPVLMDSQFLMQLQTFLQQQALEDGQDPTNHAEWAAWLND